jgi:hypothetical protein
MVLLQVRHLMHECGKALLGRAAAEARRVQGYLVGDRLPFSVPP